MFEEISEFYQVFIIAPVAYLFTIAIGHRTKISKMQTEIKELKNQTTKITVLCEDVAYIKGQIDTFLKKSG